MFFKGYVETKNKQSIEKFKNRADFKTYRQVKNLPEFAGVLSADTLLIDIDDAAQAEILFKIVKDKQLSTRVYKTRRGMHFLFKNPDLVNTNKTGCSLAIGIKADIKIGKRNSYEVIKFDGKEREVLLDTAGKDEAASVLPKYLLPVKTKADFITMDAGDGRNQAFFNYILTLQSNDFDTEEVRECIRLINEYVIKEPLSVSELDVILRDEAFLKPTFFKGTSFLFDKFAVFLKNQHHILRINNQLHLYKEGVYVSSQAEIEHAMIQHIPSLSKTKRSEVMSYLDIMIRENTPISDAKYIAFKNGVLNIDTDDFKPYSPEYVVTNIIPWNYNPNAYYELADEVINNISCHDNEIRASIEEMVGYTMFRRNELRKAFILTGSGSNGKSTFLNLLKMMLGKKNYSVLDLKKLDDRFSTIMLFNKLANIGDDISDEFIIDTAPFKKIVTGETIDAEQKGQPKFDFEPYSKLIFSANNIPRLGKGRDSSAIISRLIIIPFNARFDETTPDFKPFVIDELKNEKTMEYLINIGVKALKNLLKAKKFTISEQMQNEIREFEETNNPILGFFSEADAEEIQIENETTNAVYKHYQEYCIVNNLTALSKGEFSKQVKKHYGLSIKVKNISGRSYRIFYKDE